jgi:hypothetical protein
MRLNGSTSRAREVLLSLGLVLVFASLLLFPWGSPTPDALRVAGRPTTVLWFLIRQSDVNVSLALGCLGVGLVLLLSSWVVDRLDG